MAGNPLQKLLPYVKKYGAEIWMSLGFILFAKMYFNENSTYRWVYGENDFQRRSHLEQLGQHVREEETKRSQNVSH